jgi:O-antigen/teichoic acid export membrane protein
VSTDVAARAELAGSASPGREPALSGKLLRQQVAQYAPGVLVPAVVGIASSATFTRMFATEEYGRFALAWSGVGLLVLLVSQWLQQGIARYLPAVPAGAPAIRLKRATGLGMVLVGAIVSIVALGMVVALPLLLSTSWSHIILAAAAVTVLSVLFVPLSVVLQAEMRARRYSSYLALSSVLRLVFALVLVFGVARDPACLMWAQCGALAVLTPMLWRDARLPAGREILRDWRESLPELRRLAAYGFPVVGWTVAANILDASDRWIIQFVRGSGEVGVYGANYSLVVSTVGLIALPMGLAAHPFLMRSWSAGDREAASKWLGRIVEWYLIAGSLAVAIVGYFSRDIATLLLGPDFRAGYRIIPVVLAGMVVWQLGMYSHKPLEFTERTRLMLALCVGAALVNVALNLAIVPRYGYMGAAYTTLFTYALYTATATRIGWVLLPWRPRWRRVLLAFALTAGGLALTAAIRTLVASAFGYGAGLGAGLLVAAATAGVVVAREVEPMLAAMKGRR